MGARRSGELILYGAKISQVMHTTGANTTGATGASRGEGRQQTYLE
jgi:hypothetical protein